METNIETHIEIYIDAHMEEKNWKQRNEIKLETNMDTNWKQRDGIKLDGKTLAPLWRNYIESVQVLSQFPWSPQMFKSIPTFN